MQILKDNRDALDEIARFLIDEETITGERFMEIFNDVKNKREFMEGSDNENEGNKEE